MTRPPLGVAATDDVGSARTRLAAERYALDHHGLDDDFWARIKAHCSQAQIVELSMCIGSWLAFGRLDHVLGLDTACALPSAPHIIAGA